MALTPSQLTILRNDILADPALAEQPMNSDGAFAGRLILMGGGINGPQDVNKQVWVGTFNSEAP